MQSLVLKIWKETGKTIILITHSVEEALLLGEKVYVMAPRPGEYTRNINYLLHQWVSMATEISKIIKSSYPKEKRFSQ